MKSSVMSRVYQLSEAYLLNYAAPNHKILVEILQFDAANFDVISNNKLSQYIFALGQFIISLQYQENLKTAECFINKKYFEHALNKKRFEHHDTMPASAKKTEKERQAWLLNNDDELKSLSEELLVSEAEKATLSNMSKAYEGLLNVLKKEISSRSPE